MEINAETAVIGCMAIDSTAYANAKAELQESDFAECGELYRELVNAGENGNQVDAVDISHMKHRDEITRCIELVPSISNHEKYIEQVQAAAASRKAASIGLELASREHTIDEIHQLSARLADVTGHKDDKLAFDMLSLATSWVQKQGDKADHSVKTKIPKLDRNVCISPSQYIVIGGRPSAGKTAFSLQMALEFAIQGKKVCYFSYETAPLRLFDRLVANLGTINLGQILWKQIDTNNKDAAETVSALSELPMWLYQAAGKSVDWCGAQAAEKGADVIFVDYLGLIPTKGASRYESVTNTSLALHTLAQKSGRLVVALSQLSRNNAGTKPTIQDLRESGQIEQDADIILLLSNADGDVKNVEIAKNKDGEAGIDVPLAFSGQYQRFIEQMGENDV